MHAPRPFNGALARLAAGLVILTAGALSAAEPNAPVVLDRVVAVVNNQAILASDVSNELRLSVLEPEGSVAAKRDPHQALDELISRTLIQQQIRQGAAQAPAPSADEVQARLTELRKELPACMHQNCSTDAGWAAFLSAHQLTQAEVENYLRMRLEMLAFIENRFRQGIRISPDEIQSYYKNTLLPQYMPGERVPPLEQVSQRIEEILLQEQVNVLFDAWLDNLRKQGDVEVLDPAFAPESAKGSKP